MDIYIFLTDPNHLLPQIKSEREEKQRAREADLLTEEMDSAEPTLAAEDTTRAAESKVSEEESEDDFVSSETFEAETNPEPEEMFDKN